jgi:DNA-binding transcriptional regulator GbsR (MarR family)
MAAASASVDGDAVARFVERFALTMVETGLPRMPARVFAALLIAPDARLTAAELAERLQVSPAAVSSAVRYLTQVKMVIRERDPGGRRDHYRIYEDSWHQATMHRDEMLARWGEDLSFGIEAVGGIDNETGARLDEMRQFIAFVRDEIPQLMARWSRRRARSGHADLPSSASSRARTL